MTSVDALKLEKKIAAMKETNTSEKKEMENVFVDTERVLSLLTADENSHWDLNAIVKVIEKLIIEAPF